MKTLTLEKPGQWRVSDTPEPDSPGVGKAIVRVHRVGICGTDIHAHKGTHPLFTYPRIPGHELGVEVVVIGEGVTHIKPGDRCAVEPYMTCGTCPACRAGKTNCCTTLACLGVQTDGGMRQRIIVPAHKLHPSEKLSYEALALVETLGIGRHAVERAAVKQGERVAVIGLGPIGLTVAVFAQIAGAEVVGIDISEARIGAAESLLNIRTMKLDTEQAIDKQWAQTFGEAPAAVFDATGNRTSMQNAFALPVHGGRLVMVGLVIGDLTFSDPDFHRKEMTLLSSRNAVGEDFREIIRLIEAGRIDVGPWITHTCELEQLPDKLDDWLKPDAGLIKGMVSVV